MKNTNPVIDNYIDKAEEFAKPILKHIRELVHKACPDVEELMKWSFPHFDYKGAMFCSMASFKQHASFGFWKASIMPDPDDILSTNDRIGMGHLGKITKMEDIPPDDIMIKYLKGAMRLNDEGIKVPGKPKPSGKQALVIPADFQAAIKKDPDANKTFEDFSQSNKKEYVEWIVEAKTEATRLKRMETAVEWLSEGKIRNWKYLKK